jgi:hypothetical protein
MEQMLTGAIALGWLESANRVALGVWDGASEHSPWLYGVRMVSYGLILLAVWQKNRPRG